ncbi:hypothetical protein EVG20_g9784 [Dentipellis fragilis]|uniref:C2H2-type domain-containing protein n=1 Tax=Dentipellis fragilis TaxID=205917 RepID=A0A4Y9XVU0_9AGAM|nr:hypothetical protein EVG20_g9784 [Dentipellis fragilis]
MSNYLSTEPSIYKMAAQCMSDVMTSHNHVVRRDGLTMAYCERCDRYFPHDAALYQHEQDSSIHNICSDCDIDFTTWKGLKEHWVQSRKHDYCQHCDRHFTSSRTLQNHLDRDHYYCATHGKVFDTPIGLKEHYEQSRDHHYCQRCNLHLQYDSALVDHMEKQHFACRFCRTSHKTEAARKEHFSEKHLYCEPCNRLFQSKSNLDSHLSSSVHQPRNVFCPGRGCNRAFVSASALVLHFESGICPSGLTRQELNRLVVRADRDNLITNPERLIAGPDGARAPPTTTTWATELSWNGDAYQCFLCNRCFGKLVSLNSHLQSPRHEEKIYRCPNATCQMQFTTLGSFVQHAENGGCGVRQFKQVKSALDEMIVGGMRSLTF